MSNAELGDAAAMQFSDAVVDAVCKRLGLVVLLAMRRSDAVVDVVSNTLEFGHAAGNAT